MVTFSLPLFDSGNRGNPIGVVTADLGLESLQDMVNGLTGDGSGFLLSRKGVYLGRSEKADRLARKHFRGRRGDTVSTELGRTHSPRRDRSDCHQRGRRQSTLDGTRADTRDRLVPVHILPDAYLPASNVDEQSATLALEACIGFLLLAGAISAVIWSAIHPLAALTRAAQAVAAGNLAMPIPAMERRRDEVAVLAHAFVDMQRSLGVYVENLRQATAARQSIETELAIAKEIQASLLPEIETALAGHSEVEVAAVMRPAREVGGDFYDVFLLDEQHLCMVIADVSDKGVPAALYMSMTRTLLRLEARTGTLPDAILAQGQQYSGSGQQSLHVCDDILRGTRPDNWGNAFRQCRP